MIHHPVVLGPMLLVLGIIIAVLIVLHGILTPSQFKTYAASAAVPFFAASVAIWVLAAIVLSNPDSKIGKATILTHEARAEDGFKASVDRPASLVGKRGLALSNLTPAGVVLVEDKRLSAMFERNGGIS